MNRPAFGRALSQGAHAYAISFRPLQSQFQRNCTRHFSLVPRIAQPSFWRGLIPKPLRRERLPPDAAALRKRRPKKGWNPATFFIIIFLFIGSMSIQMISLNKHFATFIRQSDVRIGLLREVVEKLQKGEKVDVERVLGTGNPEKEEEWEEVLREIEREDAARNQKKQPKKPIDDLAKRSEPDFQPGAVKTKTTANFF